jgi:hypothetical protein
VGEARAGEKEFPISSTRHTPARAGCLINADTKNRKTFKKWAVGAPILEICIDGRLGGGRGGEKEDISLLYSIYNTARFEVIYCVLCYIYVDSFMLCLKKKAPLVELNE